MVQGSGFRVNVTTSHLIRVKQNAHMFGGIRASKICLPKELHLFVHKHFGLAYTPRATLVMIFNVINVHPHMMSIEIHLQKPHHPSVYLTLGL